MLPDDTLSDIGEQNVGRLLACSYHPEDPDPQFARDLTARLRAAAARAGSTRPSNSPPDEERWRPVRRRLGWAMGLAACLTVVALALYAAQRRAEVPHNAFAQDDDLPQVQQATLPGSAPSFGLTPRPRPEAPPARALAVGDTLTTRPGERRRVTLADGSVLYLNERTRVTQTAARRLSLDTGEIYLEVAPRPQGATGASFVIATPQRKVSALGTRFAVRAAAKGTGVVVTQGKVQVAGLGQLVRAGQQLAPGAKEVAPAPRASHQLDWTRELMAAAESPLVPCSKHAGGALIAVDPKGQEVRLTLRKYHIDVHIEDGFARTTIDQTYFNNEDGQLEGTFYFPLPPDASLSRLAMYVEAGGVGRLMEGGMAEANHARDTYETIRHARRDPALLEWVDGSTFKMRIFPLEGRKEKRLLLSYTQRLESLYGVARYRFPGGHNMDFVKDWSFTARVKNGSALHCSSPTHPAITLTPKDRDMVLSLKEKNVKPDRDVALEVARATPPGEAVRYAAFTHENARYLMVRYLPKLDGEPQRERRDWVFLFESAANRDPLLARAQIEIIRGLLKNAEHDDTFAILTAGTRTRLFDRRLNTPANVDAAVKFLEGTHLIGALDLAGAFDKAAPLLKAGKNPYLVHVGAGVPAMGERRTDALVKRLPEGVRYVGVGVGKRWNRALMKLAAERTGGYFTQVNPDEPLAWRSFELLATLNTPRLLGLRVVDNAERVTFLSDAESLAQGEEVCAIARIEGKKAELPKMLTVAGKLNGKPFVRQLPIQNVAEGAGYLPRTWAKLEIDRLLAEGGDKHKAKIIELSKAMYVMSPYTSLLVLETEADYARFKVDRGRKDHWAMYAAPAQIPIVYEPRWQERSPGPRKEGKAKTADEVLRSILVRVPTQPTRYRGQPSVSAVNAWMFYHGAYALVRTRTEGEGEIIDVLTETTGKLRWQERDESPEVLWRLLRTQGQQQMLSLRQNLEMSFEKALNWRLRDGDAFTNVRNRSRMSPYINLNRPFADPKGSSFPTLRHEPILVSGGSMPANQHRLRVLAEDWGRLSDRERSETLREARGWIRPLSPAHREAIQEYYRRLEGRELQRQSEDLGGKKESSPLGFYAPSLALVVRGTSRVHTNLMGGLVTAKTKDRTLLLGNYAARTAGLMAGEDLGDFERLEQRLRPRDFTVSRLLYQRPSFTPDRRMFGDLVSYAPGMNTTEADIAAVLEAETPPAPDGRLGLIDPAARALIEKARTGGWQAATFPGKDKAPAARLVFNPAGQFFLDHILENGLREIIVCDGQTLRHLYPEIGLGARRTLSRFHRAELTDVLPWLLPPADDLARGADVKRLDAQTVVVTPRGAAGRRDAKGKAVPYVELRLFFASDGRLSERRLVLMPEGKALTRETYSGGEVKLYRGSDTKPATAHTISVAAAAAPNLKPDIAKLVVVPMPLRTVEHLFYRPAVQKVEKANLGWDAWPADEAIARIATDCAQQDGLTALRMFATRFHAKGDRRLGFYTLLASSGLGLDPTAEYAWAGFKVRGLDVARDHPQDPLAWYLAYQFHFVRVNGDKAGTLGPLDGPANGFVQRLAALRDQCRRWETGEARSQVVATTQAEVEKAVAFARDLPPQFAWTFLNTVQTHLGAADLATLLKLSDALRAVGPKVGMEYVARYEHARQLRNADRRAEARDEFRKLYADALAAGLLPPIDGAFRETLLDAPKGEVGWRELVRSTARKLARAHGAASALALAEQVAQLNDNPLAEEVCDLAVECAAADERPLVALAAAHFLAAHGEPARALARLEPLMNDKRLSKSPVLWRLAADVATKRKLAGRAVAYLEKALDLEYRDLPEVVNLEGVRADYGRLLGQYQELAHALTVLEAEPARDFVAKVVRAADRWRSMDPDGTAACQAAGGILRALGKKDLAWDYLTTPVGQKPGESGPWVSLAQVLSKDGDFDLADRAYATAFAAEQTNAQILWDRAESLRQAGRWEAARRVYRQLAEGTWQVRFAGLQQQARAYLVGVE
jgi:ferric-dicitrate binding protein FerR (iron transport regulator)